MRPPPACQSILRFCQQALLVSQHQRRRGEHEERRCEAQADRSRRSHVRECLAKTIGRKAVAYDPGGGRRRTREIEIPLRHGIGTGKHGRNVAQKRQKSSNKNEPAAVSHKEPLTDPDATFRHSKTRAISHQELMAESSTDPKPDDLAHNSCDGCRGDQRPNIESVIPGGKKCGRDQSSLGRQWDPHAFERDESRNDPDAVDGYEVSHFVSPRPARTRLCESDPMMSFARAHAYLHR